MPPVTRAFVRTGLAYFAASLIVGVLLVAGPMLGLPGWLAGLRPVYFHLLMVGWVTQLIIGVALWMFPKYSQARPRGSDAVSWAVYGLLNGGLLLRAVAEPLAVTRPDGLWGWLLAASALLQMLAGWGFVANVWLRVRER